MKFCSFFQYSFEIFESIREFCIIESIRVFAVLKLAKEWDTPRIS